jgi:hypothetical protein
MAIRASSLEKISIIGQAYSFNKIVDIKAMAMDTFRDATANEPNFANMWL